MTFLGGWIAAFYESPDSADAGGEDGYIESWSFQILRGSAELLLAAKLAVLFLSVGPNPAP